VNQGLRYLVVGGWNTVFGYGFFVLLNVLFGDDVHYMALFVVANVVAVLNAFVCYRVFVFKVRGDVLRDLARFSLVYVGAFAVNAVALPVLVEVAGVPVLLAQAVIVGGTVVASFFAHRSFSFRRPAGA
jgi:putative flippase GtrA